MQILSLRQRIVELSKRISEIKTVQIVIGSDKKPIDKMDMIIFHVDI